MIPLTCPCCFARVDLEAVVQDEAARRALAAALSLPPALSRDVVAYLGLFRPQGRALSWSRVATLTEELLTGIRDGRIDRKGRTWRAPHENWQAALRTMIERRDAGKLDLPLSGHGYLFAVLVGLADKAEAVDETTREQQRRDRAPNHTGDSGEPTRRRFNIPSDAEAAQAAGAELAALVERNRRAKEVGQ